MLSELYDPKVIYRENTKKFFPQPNIYHKVYMIKFERMAEELHRSSRERFLLLIVARAVTT